MLNKRFCLLAIALIITGCDTIAEHTNITSDEKLVSESAGALGYSPDDLTLVSRRAAGTNTYAVLKNKNSGKEYACTINGGNLVTMGQINPPTCIEKK